MKWRLAAFAIALAAAFAVCATPAQAGLSYDLQDFIQTPQTIDHTNPGDVPSPVTFTGISGSLSILLHGGATFDPTLVQVTGTNPGANLVGPGLFYQSSQFSVVSGQSIDVTFEYKVTAPTAIIEDAALSITSGAVSGTGKVTITESAYSDPGLTNPVANTMVFVYTGGDKNFDQKFFSPVSTVYIVKDISITGGTDGAASFSNMTQSFSLVPEPSTTVAAISGLPLLGLGLWLRRRGK